MEQRARRKDQTSKQKAKPKSHERARASSEPPADLQSSFMAGIRSIIRRVWTWLHDTIATLQQSIMGNHSWPMVLVQIGLWVLLLWLLSNLHMGLPCFLLMLVYWLYITNTDGRGPAPDDLLQVGGQQQAINLCPP